MTSWIGNDCNDGGGNSLLTSVLILYILFNTSPERFVNAHLEATFLF